MYGYFYKTTNLINWMIYIGQKKGIFTAAYLGSGVYLKRAVKNEIRKKEIQIIFNTIGE